MIKNRILLLTLTILFAIVLSGTVSATSNDTYAIGENITQKALNDTNLGLNESDKNLVITTAGSAKLNNQTTEGSISGIINTTSSLTGDQKITYGNGNLIQINDPYGSLIYIFVSKTNSGALVAKKFTVTFNGLSYLITASDSVFISADITESQWNYAKQQLGDELFSIASIANIWANDAPIDLLALAESYERIAPGSISGYAATKAFIKQYPTNTVSKDYVIIVVPGGYDDDAFTYLVPWNYRYITSNGTNLLESAFIQWNSTGTKQGTLVLFKFNEDLYNEFKTLTGITVVEGTLSEIKFNNWLLELLKTNPGHLITIEKTAVINKTDLDYLIGNDTNSGKGLSDEGKSYILNLTDASASFNVTTSSVSSDDSKYNDYVTLGQTIAQNAQNVLNSLPGAYGNVSVATAPVYGTASGIYIRGFYDGFASVLGTDPNDIIALLNPYLFDSYLNHLFSAIFYIKGINSTGGDTLYALQVQYNPLTGNLTWSNPVDLLPAVKSGTPGAIPGVNSTVGKDQNNVSYFTSGMGAMPFAVMGYIWSEDVPYNIKEAWNRVAHCMSGVMDLSLIESILQNYPLDDGEKYTVIGPTPNGDNVYFSRFWAALNYLLDVSPGTGTSLTNNGVRDGYGPPTDKFVIIRENKETGKVTIDVVTLSQDMILTDLPKIFTEFVKNPNAVVDVDGTPLTFSEYLSTLYSVTEKEIVVDGDTLQKFLASGNPLESILNYVPSTSNEEENPSENPSSTGTSPTGTVSSTQSTEVSGQAVSAASSQSTGSNAGDQGQTTPGSSSTTQTGTASEVSTVGTNSSSTGGSQTPLVAGIGIVILVILVGFGFYKGGLGGLIGK